MLPTRKTTRLQGYDYAQEGMYYVTICTHEREHTLGTIVDATFVENAFGAIVRQYWEAIPLHAPAFLDAFIVMPNHVHGIVAICYDNNVYGKRAGHAAAPTARRQTIGNIVGSFKSAVTKRINETRGTVAAPVWQRNYYDHVIRNETDLQRIRAYIMDNPRNWEHDEWL